MNEFLSIAADAIFINNLNIIVYSKVCNNQTITLSKDYRTPA
jgi:hypothetical protein